MQGRATNQAVSEPEASSKGRGSGRDDQQLVQRAKANDAAALHELVDRYADDMYGTACFLVGNREEAHDVVQETLIGMIRALPSFEGRSSFKTWLWGILIRQAARSRRSAKPTAMLPDGAADGRAESSDARMDIEAALGRLSADHRQVLVLREFEGMSYAEISATLSVPQGTIESRLFRARQELKKHLAGYGPAGK